MHNKSILNIQNTYKIPLLNIDSFEVLANFAHEEIGRNVFPFHIVLLQTLEDRGGWLNEDAIIEPFVNYSRILFEEFGSKVDYSYSFVINVFLHSN